MRTRRSLILSTQRPLDRNCIPFSSTCVILNGRSKYARLHTEYATFITINWQQNSGELALSDHAAGDRENNQVAILIVDDSRVMRQALKKTLKQHYTVIEAGDGEQAWEILTTQPQIRAVFTDLSMPKLDGYGLVKRIREHTEAKINALPIIIVTGKEDEKDTLTEAQSQGANDVLLKPFDQERILALASRYLSGLQLESTPDYMDSPATQFKNELHSDVSTDTLSDALQDRMHADFFNPPQDHQPPETEGLLLESAGTLEVCLSADADLDKTVDIFADSSSKDTRTEVTDPLQPVVEKQELSTAVASDQSLLEKELAQARAQILSLQRSRTDLEQELEQLRTELFLRQQTADERRAQSIIRELEQNKTEIETKLASEVARANESDARLHGALEDVEHAAAQLAQLQEQIKRFQQEHDNLKSELDSSRQRAQTAEKLLAEFQASGEINLDLSDICADASDKLDTNQMRLRLQAAELAQLKAEDEMIQTASRLDTVESELKRAREENQRLTREHHRLRDNLREMEQDAVDQRLELESKVKQLQAQLEHTRQDAETSKRSVTTPKTDVQDTISDMELTSDSLVMVASTDDEHAQAQRPRRRSYPKGFSEVVERWEAERKRQRIVQGALVAIIMVMSAIIIMMLTGWLRG